MNGFLKTLLVLFVSFISACSTIGSIDSGRTSIQAAVDNVRSQLSTTLGKPVPSISV